MRGLRLRPEAHFERLRVLDLRCGCLRPSGCERPVTKMSGFFEIAATLITAAAVIWLPGAVAIKAADHLRIRRHGRGRPNPTDRPSEAL